MEMDKWALCVRQKTCGGLQKMQNNLKDTCFKGMTWLRLFILREPRLNNEAADVLINHTKNLHPLNSNSKASSLLHKFLLGCRDAAAAVAVYFADFLHGICIRAIAVNTN